MLGGRSLVQLQIPGDGVRLPADATMLSTLAKV